MNPGEIYFADVPFKNRSGSKVRPVVVLQVRDNSVILALGSTSRSNPNMTLLLTIDCSTRRYLSFRSRGLHGTSYIYKEGLVEVSIDRFREFVGKLQTDDFEIIRTGMNLAPTSQPPSQSVDPQKPSQ